MKRIRAIAVKEFIHIIRDRRTLTLIILMPIMQLIIYGYAVNTDVKHLATVLFDEDHSPLSRRLVESFVQSSYFDIVSKAQSPQDLHRMLNRGRAKTALHIPPDFARNMISGRSAELQLLIDGTDSNPANTALNTGQAIVTAFMQKEGFLPVKVLPIDFKPRLWYNPDLKNSFFMVPGLIGLLLQLIIPMITATSVVREKERGNLEQLLVTPIKPYELVVGKLIPYVCIGMVIAVTVISAARLLFHVPVRGNPLTLFALTLLFLTVCLGIGLLASTIAENQQQAGQIIMFMAAPSILLSGFIFPRETMPSPIYYLGFAIPLTYFLKIVRGIVLKGLGLGDLWEQILPLTVIAAMVLTLSILKFRKRLS